MHIELVASTIPPDMNAILKSIQVEARRCASGKSRRELEAEPFRPEFVEKKIRNREHSFAEHVSFKFDITGLPKIMAMTLNNQGIYATSEQSARTTKMKLSMADERFYEKWREIILEQITKQYPQSQFPKLYASEHARRSPAQRIAMENARYMTSVFTPTNMTHSLNFRQLNYVVNWFGDFIAENKEGKSRFKSRLAGSMAEFVENPVIKNLTYPPLKAPADRPLNLFGTGVEEYFGNTYSANSKVSFAAWADLLRHRTIRYQVTADPSDAAEFFVPPILGKNGLMRAWVDDLNMIAKIDFPQAQLVHILEEGSYHNFTSSKMAQRICGGVQYEVMNQAREVAARYARARPEIKDYLKPRCTRGECSESCAWGANMALERIV